MVFLPIAAAVVARIFLPPTYGADRTNSTIIYNAGSRPASSVNGIEVGNTRVKIPYVTKYRDE